jgi:hypothetical protein
LLRDARWDSPRASEVPIVGAPAPIAVARAVIGLRLRRASRLVAGRWAGASLGGGLAGLAAGVVGGLVLVALPGSPAPLAVVAVLSTIGAAAGAVGGAGVGAGLAMAEAVARSRRGLALVAGAAMGGGLVGFLSQWLARSSLAALVGVVVAAGGALEGVVIGGAAGLGYAVATRWTRDGLAAPTGRRRLSAALLTAGLCGAAALGLTLTGHPLVGGTVHAIARAAHGSQAIIGAGEGTLFGFGLALGLMRRPAA